MIGNVVYRAEDTRLGRTVALKFLSEELSHDRQAVERFRREARAASGLNHPHVCAVYELGEHAGRYFIVMELLDGATLHDHIAGRALPNDQVLYTRGPDRRRTRRGARRRHRPSRHQARQCVRHFAGLGQATGFRPGPIGRSRRRRRRHRAASAGATMEALTSDGAVLGTIAYMSPEQVRGEALDPRTDLFSLGAVL